jgi:signal transduction histidine kinase
MRTFVQVHRWRTVFVAVGLVLTALVPAGAARQALHQKQVLVLFSTRRDAQIAIVGERELTRILDDALPEGLDYYSEYIDQARFPDAARQAPFRDFLRVKYAQQQFDVVIAIDDLAVEFLERFRNDLFPVTPVVFFESTPHQMQLPNSTGVVAHLDYTGSLRLAIELQPHLRHVFVVNGLNSGPSLESRLLNDLSTQLQPFATRLTIDYLTGLPAGELERQVASLPPDSIIYYLSVSRDGAGENFHPLEYLDRLAAVANAPIYCWVDSAIDHGIVGGSLKSQEKETRAVGELARRVLQGERADAIPVSSPDLSITEVDWRQMRRWGLSESRLPAGTLVQFREPSIWDRYRIYIVGALAILLAQTALIVGLLVQRSRRRHAEEQLRGREFELRTSYERIRQLAGRLLSAQETERSRIARELHDDIVQKLAVLAMHLRGTESSRPDVGEALDRVNDLARSVRDISHELHPANLRLIGLVAALRGLKDEMSRPDVSITFTHDDVPAALPSDLTLCLFRIAQESLNNALKHSKARHVRLELRNGSQGLTLTTIDDGVGFDVKAGWGRGLGLASIAERLEAFGGSLNIHSTPGAGTRVEVTVPLPVAQRPETVPV